MEKSEHRREARRVFDEFKTLEIFATDNDEVINFSCCLANVSSNGMCVLTSCHYPLDIQNTWTIFGYGKYEVRWGKKVLGNYCLIGLKALEN